MDGDVDPSFSRTSYPLLLFQPFLDLSFPSIKIQGLSCSIQNLLQLTSSTAKVPILFTFHFTLFACHFLLSFCPVPRPRAFGSLIRFPFICTCYNFFFRLQMGIRFSLCSAKKETDHEESKPSTTMTKEIVIQTSPFEGQKPGTSGIQSRHDVTDGNRIEKEGQGVYAKALH